MLNKISINTAFLKRVTLFIFIAFLTLLMIKVKVDHIILWDMIYLGQDVAANPDADYYLKLARDLMEQQFSLNSIIQTNLLSILIALISKSTEFKELIWAGNLLTPICCALTFLAIGLFFSMKSNDSPWVWVVSFFSLLTSYLCLRMGPGYIDTDLLNVFFVYIISALIYFQANINNLKNKYFLAAALGILNFLFIRWYGHEGFTILFVIAIIASQWVAKETWKHIFGLASIFILLSALGSVHFLSSALNLTGLYITHQGGSSLIIKSHVLVQELQVSGFKEWPHILFQWPYHWGYGLGLVVISLVGNLFWLFEDKKKIFAYFIPFIFIPLSFFVADRFYIYTIPLFWFGLFFIIKVFMIKTRANVHVSALIAIMTVIIVFALHYSPRCFFIFNKACVSKVTLFRFPTLDVTNAATFASKHLIQENNTLLAWWDYGHYLAFHTKFNLVLNNGNQFGSHTAEFVDALFQEDQAKAHQKLKDLNQYRLNEEGLIHKRNKIYLLVNEDFVSKVPAFYQLTSIDHIKVRAKQPSLMPIRCVKKGPDEMMCNKNIINYKNGLVNEVPGIFKIIYATYQGKFLKEKILNAKGLDVLVNFSSDKDITSNNIIVPKWLAETTLMKLYLGQFEPKLFKLVYNRFPEAKIYELN